MDHEDDNPRPSKRQRVELAQLPTAHLLLALPSILLHPPTHSLFPRSLHLSLVALRRCLDQPDGALTPEMECRAWTALAEVGMRVVKGGYTESWANGIEGEVENAVGKGVRLFPLSYILLC